MKASQQAAQWMVTARHTKPSSVLRVAGNASITRGRSSVRPGAASAALLGNKVRRHVQRCKAVLMGGV